MRALVQRVASATMHATRDNVGSPIDVRTRIDGGLLVLLCAERGDTRREADWVGDKIARLRIFDDDQGRMNLSVLDVGAEVMVISQFTLAGECSKGNRPSFVDAAEPSVAEPLVAHCVERLEREHGLRVATGVFGGSMRVELINDGPVTLMIERRPSG
ncbi:MAG: D-aminoacyl-tRNA deacylase [Planctomycetota bacterium]|jgi:D-tyrosyl-tRNA(Tyr) deacylase